MEKKRWLIIAILLIGFIALIFPYYIIKYQTKDAVFSAIEKMPSNNVGMVLGTSPKLKNGSVNHYFAFRINATVALYNAQKINFVLVSGDNSSKYYNEPWAFKNELIKRGIPAEKIYLDYAGFRTLDSVIRAKEIFGQDSISIISQQFHNERAVYLAQKKGIVAVGFNAQDVRSKNGLKTQLREYLARTKVFWDLAVGVKPKYLGEKIKIT